MTSLDGDCDITSVTNGERSYRTVSAIKEEDVTKCNEFLKKSVKRLTGRNNENMMRGRRKYN